MYVQVGGFYTTSMNMIAIQVSFIRLALVMMVIAASAQSALLNRNINLLRSRLGDVLPPELALSGPFIQSDRVFLGHAREQTTTEATTDFCLSIFCVSPRTCRDRILDRTSCINDCLETCHALIQRK
ncbi:uncharacterized protein LOC124150022 [Haliotis rufescens]|uniref:uncharacterized protein LOC124150022 n=1 Tax=Haliotis rufescens TaxID=6454 RepID=UPI00201EB553|nr:uncharacterized protein LOC124150022 [Haliotis rufescens]